MTCDQSILAAWTAPSHWRCPTELVAVKFDERAIPEQLAGILFIRKICPTGVDISYSSPFIPPNTFARYVESGELGVRPLSETQIARAGTGSDPAVVYKLLLEPATSG